MHTQVNGGFKGQGHGSAELQSYQEAVHAVQFLYGQQKKATEHKHVMATHRRQASHLASDQGGQSPDCLMGLCTICTGMRAV